jgi:hypothetical protein
MRAAKTSRRLRGSSSTTESIFGRCASPLVLSRPYASMPAATLRSVWKRERS